MSDERMSDERLRKMENSIPLCPAECWALLAELRREREKCDGLFGRFDAIAGEEHARAENAEAERDAALARVEKLERAAALDIERCDACDNESIDTEGVACRYHAEAYDALAALREEGGTDA